MIRYRFTKILNPEHKLVKFVLVFILQHKFTMNKSKLNLGANVGDIPRGVNRPEVNPARTWRFI